MDEYMNTVYNKYDGDKSGHISRDEAINYFFDVLDVKRQYQGLSLARAAVRIASDNDDRVTREQMEHFLYELFTNENDAVSYDMETQLGMNMRL